MQVEIEFTLPIRAGCDDTQTVIKAYCESRS